MSTTVQGADTGAQAREPMRAATMMAANADDEAGETTSRPIHATDAGEQRLTLAQIAGGLFRNYLGGRRGLIVLAVAVVTAGAYFNWGWLVAAGIAPLILAFAPCAAMCALGLCMSRMGGKSCSSDGKVRPESKTNERDGGAKPSATAAPTKE